MKILIYSILLKIFIIFPTNVYSKYCVGHTLYDDGTTSTKYYESSSCTHKNNELTILEYCQKIDNNHPSYSKCKHRNQYIAEEKKKYGDVFYCKENGRDYVKASKGWSKTANLCGSNYVEITKEEYCASENKRTGDIDVDCSFSSKEIVTEIVQEETNSQDEEEQIANIKKEVASDDQLYVIGSGSGFFVNKDGYVVTNEHVAGICSSMASVINGETHIFNIIALDRVNDLALLRGKYQNKNFLNIDILGADFGEDIVTFGYPLSEDLSSTIKLTRGIVSSLSGPGNNISLIQIDAAIQPGNSGGPILNYEGQVVGVATSGLNKVEMLLDEEDPYIPENVNFGVSSPTLSSFLKANRVTIFNKDYKIQDTKELAKIGMAPTIQLFCLNTQSAYKELKSTNKYSDILFKKVFNLR